MFFRRTIVVPLIPVSADATMEERLRAFFLYCEECVRVNPHMERKIRKKMAEVKEKHNVR